MWFNQSRAFRRLPFLFYPYREKWRGTRNGFGQCINSFIQRSRVVALTFLMGNELFQLDNFQLVQRGRYAAGAEILPCPPVPLEGNKKLFAVAG